MKKLQGFSLMEVLVSLFLVSLALLGLDAMEIYSLKQAKISYFFSIAVSQMKMLSNRLRAVPENEQANQFAIWNKENAELLPHGRGILQGNYPYYSISIFWGIETLNECKKIQVGESNCLTEQIIL